MEAGLKLISNLCERFFPEDKDAERKLAKAAREAMATKPPAPAPAAPPPPKCEGCGTELPPPEKGKKPLHFCKKCHEERNRKDPNWEKVVKVALKEGFLGKGKHILQDTKDKVLALMAERNTSFDDEPGVAAILKEVIGVPKEKEADVPPPPPPPMTAEKAKEKAVVVAQINTIWNELRPGELFPHKAAGIVANQILEGKISLSKKDEVVAALDAETAPPPAGFTEEDLKAKNISQLRHICADMQLGKPSPAAVEEDLIKMILDAQAQKNVAGANPAQNNK